jgi:translation initiation factor 1
MNNDAKFPTDGGKSLGQNPFGALSGAGLPPSPAVTPAGGTGKQTAGAGAGVPDRPGVARPATTPATKNRGRVDVRRETGGRGGKTVTVIDGFVGIGLPEKEQLAKKMRAACGCGGTVKDGAIVIQGDQRETIARILSEAGFRPVFAGG